MTRICVKRLRSQLMPAWIFLIALAFFWSDAGASSLVGYTEHSSFRFLDPIANTDPWDCHERIPRTPDDRCQVESGNGEHYIINGLIPVDSGLDRTLGASLDGAPSQSDGRPWTAVEALVLDDGVVTNDNFYWGPAVGGLAFDPREVSAQGGIFSLSASLDSSNVSWTGVGFAQAAAVPYWTSGEIWAFLRSTGHLQVFANGLEHLLYSSPIPAPGYNSTGSNSLEIVYDRSTQAVAVKLNGTAQSLAVSNLGSVSFTPEISHVGFHAHRQGGLPADSVRIADIRLEADGQELFQDTFDNEERRIHYYGHLYSQAFPANDNIAGPGYYFKQATFVALTSPRTWNGMRGFGLRLENDNLRVPESDIDPETGHPTDDDREWTQSHAVYTRERGFMVSAATPGNGNNTTYGEGHLLLGTSWNGVTDFKWQELIFFDRDNHYRFLGTFLLPVDGSCAAGQCEYRGVVTWLQHPINNGPQRFGTTPITYRPCDGPTCTTAGEIELKVATTLGGTASSRTFTVPKTGGVNLTGMGFHPARTIAGRTTGYTRSTELGVTQYELWRDHKTAHNGGGWIPCDLSDPDESDHWETNIGDWPTGQGSMVQYMRYDPATELPLDANWIPLTSALRDIAPTGYSQWANWIIGRIDFGGENMLYLGNRDNHACVRDNGWDTGTGKGIVGLKLAPFLE